jgi:hypothetical protein
MWRAGEYSARFSLRSVIDLFSVEQAIELALLLRAAQKRANLGRSVPSHCTRPL